MNINHILFGITTTLLLYLMITTLLPAPITDENIQLNINEHNYNCTVNKQWKMGNDMKNHIYDCNNQTHELQVYYSNENDIELSGEIKQKPTITKIKVVK